MIKKSYYILVLIIFNACNSDTLSGCFQASGPIVETTFSVSEFTDQNLNAYAIFRAIFKSFYYTQAYDLPVIFRCIFLLAVPRNSKSPVLSFSHDSARSKRVYSQQ